MLNKILIASALTFSFVHAVDEFSSERLLGIEVGYTKASGHNDIGLRDTSSNVDFGLRVGAQNVDWRTQVIVNMSSGGGHQYQKAMISFDKFVWQSLYKKDDVVFKPYLSGHVGWLKHNIGNLDETSAFYGGGLGVSWNVLKEVDFDLGYRYSFVGLESLDDLSSVNFGVNYIY